MSRLFDKHMWPHAVVLAVFIWNAGADTIADRCVKPRDRLVKDGTACETCPTCLTGWGFDKDCGYGFGDGAVCVQCEEGKQFSHDSKCYPCTDCSTAKREFKYKCRPQINAECGDCIENYFNDEWMNPGGMCQFCPKNSKHEKCVKDRERIQARKNMTAIPVSGYLINQSQKQIENEKPKEDKDAAALSPWTIASILIILALSAGLIGAIYRIKCKPSDPHSVTISPMEMPDSIKIEAQREDEKKRVSAAEADKSKVEYTKYGKPHEKVRLMAVDSNKPVLSPLPENTTCTPEPSQSPRPGRLSKPPFHRSFSVPVSEKEQNDINEKKLVSLVQKQPDVSERETMRQSDHRQQEVPDAPNVTKRETMRQFDHRQQAVPDADSDLVNVPVPVDTALASWSSSNASQVVPLSRSNPSQIVPLSRSNPPQVAPPSNSNPSVALPSKSNMSPINPLKRSNSPHSVPSIRLHPAQFTTPCRSHPLWRGTSSRSNPVENSEDAELPSLELSQLEEHRSTTEMNGGIPAASHNYPSSSAAGRANLNCASGCNKCQQNRQRRTDRHMSHEEEQKFTEALRVSEDVLISKLSQEIRDQISLQLQENKDLPGDKNFRHIAHWFKFDSVLCNALNGMSGLLPHLDRGRKTVKQLLQAVKHIGRQDVLHELVEWVLKECMQTTQDTTTYGVKETGDLNFTRAIPESTNAVKVI